MATRKTTAIALAMTCTGVAVSNAQGTPKEWSAADGGRLDDASKWSSSGGPKAVDSMTCDLASAYTVTFTANRAGAQLLIGRDNLELSPQGHSDPLRSSALPSVALGLRQGEAARLTLSNEKLRSAEGTLGVARYSSGTVAVLHGGRWDNAGGLTIGAAGRGRLTIAYGGRVTSANGRIGAQPDSQGHAELSGAKSSWTVGQDLLVGSPQSSGRLEVHTGATLQVDDRLAVRKGSTLWVDGGTVSAGSLTGLGAIRFSGGTLNITGSSLKVANDGPLGEDLRLRTGQALNVTRSVKLAPQSTLIVANGRLSARHITNNGQMQVCGWKSSVDSNLLTNAGLIHGKGRLASDLYNTSRGQIRATRNEHLIFDGDVTNSGQIILRNGKAQFQRPLLNTITGVISGTGSLTAHAGITNFGQILLNQSLATLSGDINNDARGIITVTGQKSHFRGDVIHNGAGIYIAPGSKARFSGDVSGDGTFTGSGHIVFESSYSPGDGPAHVRILDSVTFTREAHLVLELGTRTSYDQLTLGLPAQLANVDVVLDPAFAPRLGDTYTLVTGPSITYGGPIHLPALPGGLSLRVIESNQALMLTVIPEPGTWATLALAGIMGLLRRRRTI